MNMMKKAAVYVTLAGLSMLVATQTLAMCGEPLPNGHVYVVVPQGGAIVSQTDTHNCAAGQTCDFLVTGAAGFSDTFTATPAIGYKFVGWKNAGATSFCPGEVGPCAVNLGSTWTTTNGVGHLEPIFALDLVALLPSDTRGVFQVDPGATGAMVLTPAPTTPGSGPLHILQQYSAGLDITGTADRLVLAQRSDQLDEFILLAQLGSTDFASLTFGADLAALPDYQGFPRWALGDTGLQLARITDTVLVIAPATALERVLDVRAGTQDSIALGPLSPYLAGLNTAEPNSFIYGLPARYGAVAAPGNGAASLSQARAATASFKVADDTLTGTLAFFTQNANSYTAKLTQQLTGYPTPAINGYGFLATISLNGLSVETDIRPLLKTLFLDMDAVDYAAAVAHGGNVPWMNFQVGEDPGAIFVNYEFKDEAARTSFEQDHLPTGFKLAAIPIVAGETPRYFMVQNMYQSSGGLVNGARSEWSVFVEDPENPAEPRFFVLDPKAATISADPVTEGFLTFGWPVTHELTETGIESYIAAIDPITDVETESFYSFINWPQSPEILVTLDRGFMATNDYVFWGGAVADRIIYNTTAQNPEVVLVDPNQFTVRNNSPWNVYVNATPEHAFVYLNPQEIVISPWWNLDAAYLDVSTERRTALINFKNGFYPFTVQTNAKNALHGVGVVPTAFTTAESVPTAYYHFPLTDAAGLLNAVAEPGTLTPIAVELFEGEAASYYLTLAVYQRENDPCGMRAEWITYVAGSAGRPETVRLDAYTADACLDPVSLLTVATDLSQSVNSNLLATHISSPFTRFDATIDLSSADSELTGANWLEAGDRVCSVNGICDKFYYDGALATIPAQRVDTVATVITTLESPWNAYIDTNAVRSGVRQNPALQAQNPWRNLRPFAASAPAP